MRNEAKILIKISKFILLIILSLLTGYSTLKGVTQDSQVYENYYNSISYENILGKNIYFEYLYKVFSSFSKLVLNLNYQMYASFLVFFSLYIKFYLFSKRAYSQYLIVAYLIIMYPLYESLVLRAAFGVALVFLAFEFREKKTLSLFLLLIGVLLHYSLLLMVLIWIFYHYLVNKKFAIKSLLILLSTGFIFYNFLLHTQFVSQYVDGRLIGYIIRSADYFNIWSLPKVFLLSILSYLLYKNINNSDFEGKNTVMILMFIAVSHFILAVIFFNISILYVRLVDIGILGFYLVSTNQNFKNRSLIRWVFLLFIVYEVMTRFLEIPYLVTHYILR
jgi:hypothetical protein